MTEGFCGPILRLGWPPIVVQLRVNAACATRALRPGYAPCSLELFTCKTAHASSWPESKRTAHNLERAARSHSFRGVWEVIVAHAGDASEPRRAPQSIALCTGHAAHALPFHECKRALCSIVRTGR